MALNMLSSINVAFPTHNLACLPGFHRALCSLQIPFFSAPRQRPCTGRSIVRIRQTPLDFPGHKSCQAGKNHVPTK